MLPYDETKPKSIEIYAEKLIGKTFRDVLEEYYKHDYYNIIDLNKDDGIYSNVKNETINDNSDIINEKIEYYNKPNGKGSLGNLIEKYYFLYEPNSDSNPDFPEAGTELKVTPYEKNKDKIKAGERLVIGMIPNNSPIEPDFIKSHLYEKLNLILLILYLRDRDKTRTDYSIDYVKLFDITSPICRQDFEIIREDYKIIVDKIMSGKAHELSESDTKYLGACTKGASAKKSMAPQYYSEILAKRRAFSLKQSFMTYVINNYIVKNIDTYSRDNDEVYISNESVCDYLFKEEEFDASKFDEKVIERIALNVGRTEKELYKAFELNNNAKSNNALLINRMLGVNSKNISEFEKANIKIKTVRVDKKGMPKEHMSIPKMIIKDFVKEDYDDSSVYNYFSETRFLLVVFLENEQGEYILKGSKFWNMPACVLENKCREEWEMYKSKFLSGINFIVENEGKKNQKIKNDLPKYSDTEIIHVRPHSSASAYLINGKRYGNGDDSNMDELPNGDKMTKQSFWLNKTYVAEIIKDIV